MAADLAKAFQDFFWGAAQEIQGSINSNLPKLVERVPALGSIVPGGGHAVAPELASDGPAPAIDLKEQPALTTTGDVAPPPQGDSSGAALQEEPAKDKDD